jgi:hypothetical protein
MNRRFNFQLDSGRPPVGYGLALDRLYLPLENRKGNIWLAEPEKSQ